MCIVHQFQMGPLEGAEEHQNPAVRVCDVTKPVEGGSCGFHLTRTKWDPYPWVCGVDDSSPAHAAGLQVSRVWLDAGVAVSYLTPLLLISIRLFNTF